MDFQEFEAANPHWERYLVAPVVVLIKAYEGGQYKRYYRDNRIWIDVAEVVADCPKQERFPLGNFAGTKFFYNFRPPSEKLSLLRPHYLRLDSFLRIEHFRQAEEERIAALEREEATWFPDTPAEWELIYQSILNGA